jgi:hypothetical protein
VESVHGGTGGIKVVAALMIAGISVAAALTTWRAEVAGSEASLLNRNGGVASLEASGETVQAQFDARNEQRKFDHYVDLSATLSELRAELADATSPAAVQDLRHQVTVATRVAESDHYSFPSAYVVRGKAGAPATFDVTRRVRDLLRERKVETNPNAEFSKSNDQQMRRQELGRLDMLLVAALALTTLAQLARRRRATLSLLALGGATFFAAVGLFVGLEA